MKSRFSGILFLTLSLFFAHISDTQSQTDSSKIKYLDMSLEEILNLDVVTVLKTPGKYTSAPATIHLITHEQIETRGYTSLEDVLDDIPEIEIQKRASAEFTNYFTIRGIHGSEKFIIMMDGMRINSPTGTPLSISHNYPVQNAKQIEVILGPASALYGVDAFTGIINIITFKGEDIKGVNINSSFGQYNTADNSFMAGVVYDEASFTITGNYYRSDEPYFPEIFEDEFSWYNDVYSNTGEVLLFNGDTITIPIYDYETPTNSYAIHTKLNIKNFEAGYFRNYESHGSSFSSKPEYSVYTKEAIFGEWVESVYTNYYYESKNKKFKILSTLSHSKDEVDPKSNYINTFTSFQRGYKYAYNKSLKMEEHISYKFNENNSFILGFTFQDISSLPKSGDLPHEFDRSVAASLQNMYYLGTNVFDSAGNDLTILQDFHYLKYQNIGFYTQFHSQLKEKLALTLGGRYDHNSRYKPSFNPRIGLVFTPTSKLNFKLLYGRAFFAPSPYSAYQHYGSFVPTTDTVTGEITGLSAGFWRLPKEDLKSQSVRTYEFGFSYFISKNVVYSINTFYNDVENLLSNEGYTGEEFHGIPVDYIQRPINNVNSHSYGGTVKLNLKSSINKLRLNSYLAYSFIDGEISGQSLPYAAKNTVKGGIDVNYHSLSFSPRFIYRGSSYHWSIKDENGNRLECKPYTLVNLAMRYTIYNTDKFQTTAFIRIVNLLDARYYNLPVGGSESLQSVPQDPIRINVGFNLRIL
jgi:outer membrane receptor for ferrienterochelin and colicin